MKSDVIIKRPMKSRIFLSEQYLGLKRKPLFDCYYIYSPIIAYEYITEMNHGTCCDL